MKIGYIVWLGENYELGRAYRYHELRDVALRAEQVGFDSIWLYDHFLLEFDEGDPIEGIWEGWTMMSALAEATQRVEVGSLVLCNQFRNPAILAKMAVTLDEISNGRLILGVGAGWNKAEFDAFGIPFDHRVDRFEEALQIIRPLLKEGRVDFDGTYYQARDCEIIPGGPRPDGPPLMVGSRGPRMLRFTAQYADIWNIDGCNQPELLEEPLVQMKAACAEVGRDLSTLEITARVTIAFPDIGQPPAWMDNYLSGSDEEIATAIKQYEALGVSHLMFHCGPFNMESLAQLASAMELYRNTHS